MGLSGNLSDLPLGDIIQLLTLSRKSGVLSLRYSGRTLQLVFQDGMLRAAHPDRPKEALREFALKQAKIEPVWFEQASALYEGERQPDFRRFEEICLTPHQINRDKFEMDYIHWLVRGAFNSNEQGLFNFDLTAVNKFLANSANTGWVPILATGVNPQAILLDAARQQDEEIAEKSGDSLDIFGGDFGGPAAGTAEGAQSNWTDATVLVIDDNATLLKDIGLALQTRGVKDFQLMTSVESLEAWTKKHREPKPVSAIVDLVMPKKDHSGMLGGVEAAHLLRQQRPDARIFLAMDVESPEIDKLVSSIEINGRIQKPGRKEFSRDAAAAVALLLSRVDAAAASGGSGVIVKTGKETDQARVMLTPADNVMHVLRTLVDELVDAQGEKEITLLILRFAAEVMSRAILFVVQGGEAVGIGQCGLDVHNADDVVRHLRMPITDGSTFGDVIASRQAYRGALARTPAFEAFMDILGHGWPTECYVTSLHRVGGTIWVLYGDDLPDGQTIGDTSGLEIFLKHAALALDRTRLAAQLSALQN